MLRINPTVQKNGTLTLQLEGWIQGEGVALLAAEGQRWWTRVRQIVLDLDGVKSIDAAWLALLQGWSGPRLVLCGGSEYLRALLQAEGLEISQSANSQT